MDTESLAQPAPVKRPEQETPKRKGRLPWLRLYSEARNDAKLRVLADDQHRVWFNLLCLSGEQQERGVIAGYEEFLLAVEVANGDADLLRSTLTRLQQLRIIAIDGGTVAFLNFTKRQYDKPSDEPEAVRERVSKHRDEQQAGETSSDDISLTNPLRKADITVTEPLPTAQKRDVTRSNAEKRAVTRSNAQKRIEKSRGEKSKSKSRGDQTHTPLTPRGGEAAPHGATVGGGATGSRNADMAIAGDGETVPERSDPPATSTAPAAPRERFQRSGPETQARFEQFRDAYPRPVGPDLFGQYRELWADAETFAAVLAGLAGWQRSDQWQVRDKIANAEMFLSREDWKKPPQPSKYAGLTEKNAASRRSGENWQPGATFGGHLNFLDGPQAETIEAEYLDDGTPENVRQLRPSG